MNKDFTISFDKEEFPSLKLEEGAALTENLTVQNSCVLFGCRTGICGTCVVEIDANNSLVPEISADERDLLDLYAPENPRARLACQLRVTTNMKLKRVRPV
jgi:ferredoxin